MGPRPRDILRPMKTAIVFGCLVVSGCGGSDPTWGDWLTGPPTGAWIPQRETVSKSTWTPWPFTVDSGTLWCSVGLRNAAWFETDGYWWALNGTARNSVRLMRDATRYAGMPGRVSNDGIDDICPDPDGVLCGIGLNLYAQEKLCPESAAGP